ncbi:headcase protein homolog [Xenia sp. Carnegie-2017]|uniref:headcase protein homolog n=1 Tax=Xenia sp. Carnegie-2017 TaxID=2897299 RepID=UPI001F03CE4D|nr:headcase protein homolog [Xenia sp. Carnegie-2017]
MPFAREEKHNAKSAKYNDKEPEKDVRSPVENGHDLIEDEASQSHDCCYPRGCTSSDLKTSCDSVHFFCSNDQCDKSGFMHPECADAFEEDLIAYCRNLGRARGWSEKQRYQNIWTKKGYDLVSKRCACSCGKGYLKKDLDYKPAEEEESFQQVTSKRKKGKNNQYTLLSVSPNCNNAPTMHKIQQRKLSLSPTDVHHNHKSPSRRRSNSKSKDIFQFPTLSKLGDQCVTSSFPWRTDFGTMVKNLPRQKVNPCHIKMDDDFSQSDDPRSIILKALVSNCQTAVRCVTCNRDLPVFANYPLLDGTFFLSPKELTPGCIALEIQSRMLFLTAVCMHCLQGTPQAVKCKFCNTKWDGSHHQIGTLYWYDIFAAAPCCDRRVECRKCGKPVRNPENGKQYFSDYSRQFECPHCSYIDCHYVKPLTLYKLAN